MLIYFSSFAFLFLKETFFHVFYFCFANVSACETWRIRVSIWKCYQSHVSPHLFIFQPPERRKHSATANSWKSLAYYCHTKTTPPPHFWWHKRLATKGILWSSVNRKPNILLVRKHYFVQSFGQNHSCSRCVVRAHAHRCAGCIEKHRPVKIFVLAFSRVLQKSRLPKSFCKRHTDNALWLDSLHRMFTTKLRYSRL